MTGSSVARLDAVLFDMDGTLTDSEKLWSVALDETAAELGGVISPAARTAMVGLPLRPSVDIIHAEVGIQRHWTLTADLLSSRTAVQYQRRLPWRPGAAELLAAVRAAGLRTALVTATERPLVELALETLGRHNFDVVISGDDVTLGKPDPQPYLCALDGLGVGPGSALAIEDSPSGTVSAIAAGLTVLVVPCEVPVPAGERRVFAKTLHGLRVEHLRTVHAARSDIDLP